MIRFMWVISNRNLMEIANLFRFNGSTRAFSTDNAIRAVCLRSSSSAEVQLLSGSDAASMREHLAIWLIGKLLFVITFHFDFGTHFFRL